jgi:serine protease Do
MTFEFHNPRTMKTHIRYSLLALCLSGVLPGAGAADEKPATRNEKKPLRVLAPAPGREPRLGPREGEKREKVEMETVAFLGVETAPVSPTTSAQLGLARGTGLVVTHIVANSAADGVLNEHDILLKLDDQILIESRQLSVLVRNRKEGDEVTFTYLRGGKQATAKVKLGKTEVPKMTSFFEAAPLLFPPGQAARRFEFAPGGFEEERADVDRVLSMIRRGAGGDPVRIQVDRSHGPGFRAMTVHTDNSNIVLTDDEGSLELNTTHGKKTLVAKNAAGEELFSGPVSTAADRQALPSEVRARLEKLEGMHDVTFRTDGDFKGAASRGIRPRGIAFPFSERLPTHNAFSPFY